MTKRVILTGASSGIGRETALLLSEARFELVLVARREDLLREVAQECRDRGAVSADVISADLSASSDVCADVIQEAIGSGSSPLVLVNNAGRAEFGPYAEMDWHGIERSMALNVLGPMCLCHTILPEMLARGGSQIVNVLSIAATHNFPNSEAYCAAKAGLLAFGRSLALSYRRQGIRVTSILPGSVDTPLWDGKGWSPPSEDMLSPSVVAEAIRDIVISPPDRNYDEIVLMPPKGIL